MTPARPSKPRLVLFAFGDFAFNIFWQSVMLYLLFYYTDALDIPIKVAATTYMIASVWDGLASFGVGVLVDQLKFEARGLADQPLQRFGVLDAGDLDEDPTFALVDNRDFLGSARIDPAANNVARDRQAIL